MISRMVFTISAVSAWQVRTVTVRMSKKGSRPSQPTTTTRTKEQNPGVKTSARVSEVAQRIAALAAKPDDPSSVGELHTVGGRTNS